MDALEKPHQATALIGIYDISGFVQLADRTPALELFDLLNDICSVANRRIASARGRIVKHLGDGSLYLFPEDAVDQGIKALLALKTELEQFIQSKGFNNKLTFSTSFGEVVVGKLAPFDVIDVIGKTVQIAFSMLNRSYRNRFIISPQVFRKLKPDTRKLFHRFTPPQVYLST